MIHYHSDQGLILSPLPQSTIISSQPSLTSTLRSLLTPPPPTSQPTRPPPGRPARHLIARILVLQLQKGDPKGLYDLGQALLRGLTGTEGKGAVEREVQWRVANGWCLGVVWDAFGQQVMSLFLDVIFATTKIYRMASYVSRGGWITLWIGGWGS